MPLVGREYISMNSLGDIQALTELVKQLANRLQPLLNNDTLTGYDIVILRDSERIAEEMLDERDVLLVTHGVLPAVFVAIGFYSDKSDTLRSELESLENDYSLRMVSGHAH